MLSAQVAGRAAREALAGGEGEVCAVFRRSFYLRCPMASYACIGDAALGRGPLKLLVSGLRGAVYGTAVTVSLEDAKTWEPPPQRSARPNLKALHACLEGHVPDEGLGCLILGAHNALSGHAQPALEALERWLVGNALGDEAEQLIGLGPGLTPSGDDYLGGMLVALRWLGRGAQADGLWRWLQPRLAVRTSAISAAHLAAAAAGEAHEALHEVLSDLGVGSAGPATALSRLDSVGHTSGWDALAGIVAVARTSQ